MDQPQLPPAPPMPVGAPSPEPPSKGHTARNVGIVVLVVLVGAVGFGVAARRKQDGGAAASATSSASASVSPVSIMPGKPFGLKASPTTTGVTLTWRPARDGNPAVSYVITRNSTVVHTIDASRTTWKDTHLIPGHLYWYTVTGVDASGAHSFPASINTKTTVPPLSVTPVVGRFDVSLNETSHFGFASFTGYHESLGWKITPDCASSVCGIDVRDLHDGSNFHVTLAKHGTTFSGSLRTRGFGSCNGTTTYADVTITMHPTQAKDAGNKWRVTKLAGTLVARTAAQLGCVSSGIDFSLAANYYG